jgi:predicted GNAT family acetyltransferase
MSGIFKDNSVNGRYEYHIGDAFAFANYRKDAGTLYIDYVESPPLLRGTGAASLLMREIVMAAAAGNLKIVPICGYAASWLRKQGEKPPKP